MKSISFFITFLLLSGQTLFAQVGATDAGTTPGVLEVSLTGAATYAVPIDVPPGIKNVAPGLSLTYNSQAGNAVAGWGWNISGLSSITRVISTFHHDGEKDAVDFDTLDRFALDGQRLIAVSGNYGAPGTQYATEQYSNIKVYGYGTSGYGSNYGPQSFLVLYPDGSRAWYGNTSDSRGRLEWAINKWQDPQGNSIQYKYLEKGNLLKISEIGYGSQNDETHLNKVKFYYKNTTYGTSSYFGGIQFLRDEMLNKIEISYQATKLRTYQLGHENTELLYPKLTYIQELDGDNNSLEPIRFTYQTSPGRTNATAVNELSNYSEDSIDVTPETHGVVSGDFNGDGRMDLISYEKTQKNKVDYYSNLHTGSLLSTELNISFDEIVTGAFLDENNKVSNENGVTFINDTYSVGVNSMVTFSTYKSNGFSGLVNQNTKSWSAPAYVSDISCGQLSRYPIPKRYVSGDFNGDGLADIIALTLPYFQQDCNRMAGCDDQNEPEGACCTCTQSVINISESYFIDLDRRKTSDFTNQSGALDTPIKTNDRIFPGDMDGDGKNELFIVSKGKVTVYGLDGSNILMKITEFSDTPDTNESVIQTNEQFLIGDFNGDGKTDLLFPLEVFTENWRLVESNGESFNSYVKDMDVLYRKNEVFTAYTLEQHYIAQDFNGDGKSDILSHSTSHANPGYTFSESENLDLYYNYTQQDGTVAFITQFSTGYNSHGRDSFGIPIIFEANESNPNFEYGIIADNKITAWELLYDHRISTTLEKVENNGLTTTIFYDDVIDDGNQNGTYVNNNLEAYPYANIENAKGFKVVRQLKQQGSGITRYKDFSYQSAVSHLTGLGFMGFSFHRRSNWHGDGVTKLWNHAKYDVKKRGAVLEEWTANFASTVEYNSASHTKYEYTTILNLNKTFINVQNKVESWDKLKGLSSITNSYYDEYYNPSKFVTSNSAGSVTEDYLYYNNVSSNDNTYHVGRLKNKKTVSVLNGNSFGTEQNYVYDNNLLIEFKTKANNSNWVIEEYLNPDQYGNMRTKQLSGTNLDIRAESYIFDDIGRFMTSKTSVDGLTTSYQYYQDTGDIKQVNDAYGLVTKYEYDGWNRLVKETNYLNKIIVYDYSQLNGGGIMKRVNYPQGSDEIMEYNALGWLLKSRTLTLANKWIEKSFRYDVAGRKTHESEPYFSTSSASQWNETVFDEYDRILENRSYTGRVSSFVYNGLTTNASENGRNVSTTLDGAGNIASVTDNGGTINYTYFGNGSLHTTSYAGQTITNFLDEWGHKNKMIDPSAGTYTYQYNDYGEILKETNPKGATDYNYYPDGKLKTKNIKGDLTDLSLEYIYNGEQLVNKINGKDLLDNNRTYSYNYTYDSYQRLEKVTEANGQANFEKSFDYDSYGRLEYETFVSSASGTSATVSTKNVFDTATGILREIRDANNSALLWQLNEHDHRGQTKKITLGNGFVKNNSYDTDGSLNVAADSKGSGTNSVYALHMDYSFDAKKGVLDSRNNVALDWNESFEHDALQRLTNVSGPSPREHRYDIDDNNMGRIKFNSLVGNYAYNNVRKYQIGSLDLNESGQAHYQDNAVQQISYNAFKKPMEISEPNKGKVSFVYGPMGNRSQAWYGGEQDDRTQRRYVKHYSAISPVEIVEDKEEGNVKIVTYVGGNAYSAPMVHITTKNNDISGFHYLHRDYLGSILAITDALGVIKEQRQFGAWGTVDKFIDSDGGTVFNHDSILGRGYTGHEHFFEVSLIHMNGRMYDAVLGRFLSPDNFVQDPHNTQNFNRYGYVLNNPLINNDPSGEEITIGAALLIGALVGILTNGVANTINGQGFFEGVMGSAIIGAWGAGVANGIGTVASSIGSSLSTAGQAAAQIGFQAAAHGALGGFMNGMSGGDFWSGVASGAIASTVALGTGKFLKSATTFWKSAGTIAAAGVSGGLGSSIAGGRFWDGLRNGLISSTLNHVAHQVADAIQSARKFVIGIYGAGGENAGDNPTLKELVHGKGGEMWHHYDAAPLIEYVVGNHDGRDIEIYGYSRGGNIAVVLANRLGENGIRVSQLVTFDPHSFSGRHNLKYDNVDYGANFYQQNPTTWGPFGANPYNGSKIFGSTYLNNINFTGQTNVTHLNIIRTSQIYNANNGGTYF